MEQKPPQSVSPVRIIREPHTMQYYIGPRGLIFYLLAILILSVGAIGYLRYESYVKPYLEVYICCIPTAILAGILIFFGFATRVTTVRKVQVQRPAARMEQPGHYTKPLDGNLEPDMTKPVTGAHKRPTKVRGNEPGTTMHRYEPPRISKDELMAQKRNLAQFLKNLDEQHRDGLIMNDVYYNLQNKYKQELAGLNVRLKSISSKTMKKIKRTKVKKD